MGYMSVGCMPVSSARVSYLSLRSTPTFGVHAGYVHAGERDADEVHALKVYEAYACEVRVYTMYLKDIRIQAFKHVPHVSSACISQLSAYILQACTS